MPLLATPLVLLAAAVQDPTVFALEGARFGSKHPTASQWFGGRLDLDGDTAVIAAPYWNNGEGAAFAMRRDAGGTWVQEARFHEGSVWNEMYADTVAVALDTIVVGAQYENVLGGQDGACYVYERTGSTWSAGTKLLPTPLIQGNNFGSSLDMDGDLLAVGAMGLGDPSGCRAYVFRRVGGAWTQEAILPGAFVFGLGFAIAVEGDTVVATNPSRNASGGALVFERVAGTWKRTQELIPSDDALQGEHWFGAAAALEGGVLAITNPYWDSPTKGNVGAVYVFERSGGTWVETTILEAPGAHAGDYMGYFVRVDGDLVAAGGRVLIAPRVLADCVHLWRRGAGSWTYAGRALSQAEPEGQAWGVPLALDQHVLLAGSPDFGGVGGTVFPFDLLERLGTKYCQANPNSTGAPSSLVGFGSPLVTDDTLVLQVTGLPPDRFGIFLMSAEQDFVPHFGQGNLCLGGSILRFRDDVQQADFLGEVALRIDLTDLPQGTVVLPGDTWNFQWWHRDFDPTLTSNASDGLEVSFQ